MRFKMKNPPLGQIVSMCLLLVLLTGCQETNEGTGEGASVPEVQDEPVSASLNMLTAEEEAEGWQLLFDGTNMDHWRGYKAESVPEGWVIDDGAIHYPGESPAGDIITRAQYDNFELSLEWKIAKAGNSGIFFRVTEDHDNPWQTGPEVQVLDDAGHPDAQNGGDRVAGANYDMHAPSMNVVKPAGEWNAVRLVVTGPHVEHWLNGEKIVEYELWTEAWEEQVANSKWNEHPDYGRREMGHIGLQDHSDPVWFRNIKIKPLGEDTASGT